MRQFFAKGSFCLWTGDEPSQEVTARVLHNLTPAYAIGFAALDEMMKEAAANLRQRKVRDNRLVLLDASFQAPVASVEDAAMLCLAEISETMKMSAVEWLIDHRQSTDGKVFWEPKISWGGMLEATSMALRGLAKAGALDAETLRAGLRFVAKDLIDGRLYSTADTKALVELLSDLTVPSQPLVRLDGKDMRVTQPERGRIVEALQDGVLVKVDERRTIDLLQPKRHFSFTAQLQPGRQLRLGQTAKLVIYSKERTTAPLAYVVLPGCLAFVQGGATAQTAHQPILGDSLELTVVAARRGHGIVRVMVHDMYDPEKVGVQDGIGVVVA